MYRRIFVPTDGSELSDQAVAHAGSLARSVGARVILFHAMHFYATPALYGMMPESRNDADGHARELLEAAAKNDKLAGVNVTQEFVSSDFPAEAIVDAATANQCDLIVMASHGRRGMSALLLGSETQKVLTHSKIPVLIVR